MRSLVVLFVMSVLPVVQPRAFDYCKDECNRFNGGLGTCQEDGTCACAPGWTGEGCELPNPGISKEKRRDDQYAYSYVVSPAAEIQVSDVVFDPSKKVLFVSAYDANTGAEVVYEADPLNPATYTSGGFTSRGWRSSGPNRADPNTKQPTPLTPTSGYCGAAVGIQTEPGCAAVTHARANGHADAATSGGWYSVFRGLALDTSGSITGVYGVHNMHKSAAGDPAFAFKIVKYLGTDCSSAAWDDCVIGSDNNRDPSHAYSGNGIIDAMASNEATGHVVYKVSNADGASQATIGLLSPTLTVEAETPLVADLLSGKCAACATSYDALKFDTATYALSGADAFVIFAGAAKVEADGTSYPALFKVPAGRDDFVAANGHGVEMYLDATAVKVTSACEGVVDAKQGRFTTFTIVTKHGSFGYAGTSGRDENCVGCEHRSACVFVFPLNFSEGDSPSAMIALNGGEGGLDEKDVWAATIEPDAADADAGFMYLAVGPKSNTAFGRIVKVEIGGVDVAAGCVSGCFKRVGTFKEIVPFGGLAYVADLKGIVSLSRGDSSTTYTKYSTASITSISPQFVSSTTTGTLVTIHGTGFYTPANDDPTHKTHTVSCRFGHASVVDANFQTTGWVPATVVSSTELTCEVPSAANTISTSTTHAEVQISFDGFPVDGDSTFYWQRSLWNNDKAIVFYYDPPNLLQLETTGHDMPNDGVETDFNAKILFTGEDPDLNPATLKIYGGKFIDSDGSLAGSVQRLTCRYNGDSSSDLPGTYISQTLMECPLCVVSNATGRNRCGTHGQVKLAAVHSFRLARWWHSQARRGRFHFHKRCRLSFVWYRRAQRVRPSARVGGDARSRPVVRVSGDRGVGRDASALRRSGRGFDRRSGYEGDRRHGRGGDSRIQNHGLGERDRVDRVERLDAAGDGGDFDANDRERLRDVPRRVRLRSHPWRLHDRFLRRGLHEWRALHASQCHRFSRGRHTTRKGGRFARETRQCRRVRDFGWFSVRRDRPQLDAVGSTWLHHSRHDRRWG